MVTLGQITARPDGKGGHTFEAVLSIDGRCVSVPVRPLHLARYLEFVAHVLVQTGCMFRLHPAEGRDDAAADAYWRLHVATVLVPAKAPATDQTLN